MADFSVDCVVIGAGVVGLAVGRALALTGREVLVLEAEKAIGTGTSSRNSEVIHAGLYYPTGSLKARTCVAGRDRLYAYAQSHGIGHRRCGKMIVATDESQLPKLQALLAQAHANGVSDVHVLSAEAARAMEPEVHCIAALASPSTGIVDSHGLMLALQGDLEAAGGSIALQTKVVGGRVSPLELDLCDGSTLGAQVVVNAAGHGAPRLLPLLKGFPQQHAPQGSFAKGHYFSLVGKQPFSRLIYPMPVAAGLGIHATLDLQGRVRFGPDVEWVNDDSDYRVDEARIPAFEAAIRSYWPALPPGALQAAYTGIRPKIHTQHEPMPDFRVDGPQVHGVAGLVNMLGIESPGLTSSLALADLVVERLVLA